MSNVRSSLWSVSSQRDADHPVTRNAFGWSSLSGLPAGGVVWECFVFIMFFVEKTNKPVLGEVGLENFRFSYCF